MGITEEHIESLKKWAEILESCGKAAGGISSELDALLQDNQQMEQQIESLNEANDRLRERLNRSENHDEYMKLPVDADGELIRIGDVVYGNPGVAWMVVGLRMSKFGWKVAINNLPFLCEPDDLSHKQPEPPDSWEKLRADLMLTTSTYCYEVLHRDCSVGIPYEQRAASKADDVIARAKKLAGIEEGVE